MERRSIISMAPGTIPASTMAVTASPAALVSSKKASIVLTLSGAGTTRRVILVATPSVPSEPTKAPRRSYPGASRSSVTIVPSESTTSNPIT
jgi:hypothetical protein